jgi:acyl carrier protein
MNRTFDVPLDMITADSELEDLGIDDSSFDVILMNIESRMNVALPVDEDYKFRNIGDVITMIKSSNN